MFDIGFKSTFRQVCKHVFVSQWRASDHCYIKGYISEMIAKVGVIYLIFSFTVN